VIDNADDFEKFFFGEAIGVANPDFRGQMVIAIIKGVDTNAGISFIKAEVNGNTMKVQFDMTGSTTSANDHVVMATVPRVAGLSKIDFYKGNDRMATISR
jgi:hypothetical protein